MHVAMKIMFIKSRNVIKVKKNPLIAYIFKLQFFIYICVFENDWLGIFCYEISFHIREWMVSSKLCKKLSIVLNLGLSTFTHSPVIFRNKMLFVKNWDILCCCIGGFVREFMVCEFWCKILKQVKLYKKFNKQVLVYCI